MTTVRRLRRTLHTALLVLALALAAGFAALTALGATAQARVVPVLTGSMSPTIPAGSLVVATPIAKRKLRVGDVVVFQRPYAAADGSQVLMMHRVTHLGDENGVPVMRTKGDANPTEDPWSIDLTRSVVYRVRVDLPKIGVLFTLANKGQNVGAGWRVWCGLLLLAAAGTYATRLRRRSAAEEREHGTAAMVHEALCSLVNDLRGGADLDGDLRMARVIRRHAQHLAASAVAPPPDDDPPPASPDLPPEVTEALRAVDGALAECLARRRDPAPDTPPPPHRPRHRSRRRRRRRRRRANAG